MLQSEILRICFISSIYSLHLQVNFLYPRRIHAVVTQGTEDGVAMVTNFYMKYGFSEWSMIYYEEYMDRAKVTITFLRKVNSSTAPWLLCALTVWLCGCVAVWLCGWVAGWLGGWMYYQPSLHDSSFTYGPPKVGPVQALQSL